MNAIPIALFWLLVIWAAASRRPVALYLFFATMPFGAFAVIPTQLTGGLTFIATPIAAIVVIAKAFLNRQGPSALLSMAIMPNRLLFLFAFWTIATVTTFFMPRLLAGDLLVVPVRGVLRTTAPLAPSTQNLSQWVYMTISVFTVFALARHLRSPDMRQHALQALCLGAAMLIVTGLLDYASQFLPLAPLLQPFRTASYALATEVEVMGSKRVVGLMPEASAFGTYCLGFLCSLYFYRRAITNIALRTRVCPPILIALLLLCWQSKSSAAYVGMGLFVAMACAEWLLRANKPQHTGLIYRQGLLGELSVPIAILTGVTMTLLLKPDLLDPIYAMIDRMVLQKGSSHSYEERGMWRSIALASVFESHGFGIGLGSTRASSSIVAIFSATGILGGVFFCAFIAQSCLRSASSPELRILASGFRFAYIPMFTVSLMIADANFDFVAAFGFGLATALSFQPDRPVRAASSPYFIREPMTAANDVVRTSAQAGSRNARPGITADAVREFHT
ncbi:hypothetical protein ACLIMP_15845 [Novosphingobium aerophilum]|uniref:hypothetical protein n=1 Tax=Novosphingobium TaxID=165696 RepID=UPI0012C59936|nr:MULTISPECIES: hypothetical protein [unclassified Novosphingobium]MPS70902.1 hypothetical protein [Novosphingobium sp.]WRT92709.1 hypothetical protein U9J33_16170 [Novosphingobium sp. RL4]